MYGIKKFLFICVNIIIFTPGFSDVQLQKISSEHVTDVDKDVEKSLEYKRRQAIASNYLNTLETVKEEWIDPYDMTGLSFKHLKDVKHTSSPPTSKDDTRSFTVDVEKDFMMSTVNNVQFGTYEKSQEKTCVLDNIYITRWLKKILLEIGKVSDEEPRSVSFALDSSTLGSLKELSASTSFEVAQFDEIMSKLISQAVITRKEGYNWTWLLTYALDISCAFIYTLSIGVIIFFLYCFFRQRPILFLLCCCVVISVFWHWMHLYQQKKAHKHAELSSMKIPDQCRKHDFGLFEHIHEYIKSYFTTNECGKYYEALLVDPFWEVSFSVAASEAVTAALFQPLSASSRALNTAVKQLFDGLNISMVIFLILFLFLLVIMLCNYRIRLPFFMGAIEPCFPTAGSRVEELQNPSPLSKLKDSVCNTTSSIQSTCINAILEEDSRVQASSPDTSSDLTLPKSILFPRNATDFNTDIKSQRDSITYVSGSKNFAITNVKTFHKQDSEGQAVSLYASKNVEASKSVQYIFNDTDANLNKNNGSKNPHNSELPCENNLGTLAQIASVEAILKEDSGPVETTDVMVSKSIQISSSKAAINFDKNNDEESSSSAELYSGCCTSLAATVSNDKMLENSCKGFGDPLCDSSWDILQECKGCTYCKNRDPFVSGNKY